MRSRRLRAALVALTLVAPMTASAQSVPQPDPVPNPLPMEPDLDGNYFPDPRQEVPLSEAELMAAFSDKTHRGTYNFQRRNIDTFAFVETTASDGRTRHVHGDKVDTGTWRVKENVICFVYDNWDGGVHRACFNIFKRGNCYYHYGLNFGRGGSFTARSVHDGETPDCEPSMV